jgi:membrane protein DedA with SNARE-associated domain
MIESIVNWLSFAIESLGYPGVAIAVFLESFFAPIPSELILPFSGFVASTGALSLFWVIVVATVAGYLGSLPFYLLGLWGEKPVYTFLDRWGKYLFIEKRDVDYVFELFKKRGKMFVLFGRLIPIVRTLISFPAGVFKMNFVVFSLYTLIGALIWNALLTYLGYLMGANWEVVGMYLSKYEGVILVLAVVAVVVYIGRGIYRRTTSKNLD